MCDLYHTHVLTCTQVTTVHTCASHVHMMTTLHTPVLMCTHGSYTAHIFLIKCSPCLNRSHTPCPQHVLTLLPCPDRGSPSTGGQVGHPTCFCHRETRAWLASQEVLARRERKEVLVSQECLVPPGPRACQARPATQVGEGSLGRVLGAGCWGPAPEPVSASAGSPGLPGEKGDKGLPGLDGIQGVKGEAGRVGHIVGGEVESKDGWGFRGSWTFLPVLLS